MFMDKEIYKLHADICKTLSNPIRLEILNLLRLEELSVSNLIAKTKLSQANISQHLSIMKSRGIVDSRREGNQIYYKIVNKKIVMAFDIMREVLIEKLNRENKIISKNK